MTCVQCGHPHPALIARRLRPARYSCRSCGAVFRAGPEPAPGPEPERFAPVDGDPLAAFMPARMVRWVRETGGDIPAGPDRVTLARWYKDFDALVAGARTSAEARAAVERVSEVPLDALPAKPPAFSKVCGALHATCYDPGLAVARLGQDEPFVAERVGHLRRWLATAGRSTTWPAAPESPPPARDAVEGLLTLPDSFTTDQVRTLFCALFGVDKGPSVPGVRDRFGDERIRQALLAYLETGDRPLRRAVLAELADEPDVA
ncbi:hypothetical protein [Nonomuraea sp. LPB2021202275-12-8]|uniref:hypothetical protein n=1 Tax=Nonomuraea sp. LPB2021202275-12-8 TaxID=3120159 RepID=UPI00300D28DF